MSEYIGKFVCYNQADGGACWGRIKDEAIVNSMDGEKEVFILEHRYVRYLRTKNLNNFRTYFPDLSDLDYSKATIHGDDKKEELFFEIRRIKGDSILHKHMIDLKNDLVDLDDVLAVVDDETLFKAILSAKTGAKIYGKNALEIGLNALLMDKATSHEASAVLKKRLHK
jgi:hypothetical protein